MTFVMLSLLLFAWSCDKAHITNSNSNAAPNGVIDLPNTVETVIGLGATVAFAATCTDPEASTVSHLWTFDGGAPDQSVEDPGAVAFADSGTYRVTYLCTDAQGVPDPEPANVLLLVNASPDGAIEMPSGDLTVDVGGSVEFAATCSDDDTGGATYSHLWDFGLSGVPANNVEDPGALTFATAGVFVVTYTCTDALGVDDPTPAQVTVTVNGAPEATITAPAGNVGIEPGHTVTFAGACVDDGVGGVSLTHAWDFDGAAAASTEQNPGVVTFADAGIYHVSYVCTDARAVADPTPAMVTVTVAPNTPPTASIEFPEPDGIVDAFVPVTLLATCTDDQIGGVPTHAWDFDTSGVAISNLEDPTVTFAVPGIYTLTYTCTDALGLTPTAPAVVVITVNGAPNGVIDTPAAPPTIDVGQSVSFTASCSDDNIGGASYTHAWNFGGGAANSTAADPGAVAFVTAGTFTVSYTCSDARGIADPSVASVVVTVNGPPLSSIDAPASAQTIDAGQSVIFTGTCIDDGVGGVSVTHAWNFGGGATNSSAADPGSVTFATPGVFTVSYACTDIRGLADTSPASVQITVNGAPNGVIDSPAAATTIAVGGTVSFTGSCTDDNVGGSTYTHAWNFAGGATNSTLADPGNISFASAGSYTVTYTCTDARGVADTSPAQVVITVNGAPNGTIDTPATSPTILVGQSVAFTASCIDPEGQVGSHAWNFGGGASNSAVEDPGSVTFATAGSYTVTYTCTDQQGVADPTPASIVVWVNGPPNSSIDTPAGNQTINVLGAVNFAGTCTDDDVGGTNHNHYWNFDGGAASTNLADPGSVTFAAPGTYVVTYTCTDALGTDDPTPAAVTITVNGPPDGVINTPAAATTIDAGGSVAFTGTCTDDDVGGATRTHLWSFGGGASNSTSEDPGSISFATAGRYTVTYTCTDARGIADATPATLVVTVRRDRPLVATATDRSCVINRVHELYCTGFNRTGNLGVGSAAFAVGSLSRVGAAADWATLGVGANATHSCAINFAHELWCWGNNNKGQLGLGTTTDQNAPTRVGAASNWASVSTGSAHTCAVTAAGTLFCWGHYAYGKLGLGAIAADVLVPTQVGSATDWAQVAVGTNNSCARTTTNALYCWGRGDAGTNGTGNASNQDTPALVAGAWTHIAVGTDHACAVNTAKELHCWGSPASVPTRVGSASNWAYVAVAGQSANQHSCAVNEAGQLFCWGINSRGTLGDGSVVAHVLPTQVGTDTDWREVTVGYLDGCGVKSGGQLWCWGNNSYGQLGLGTIGHKNQPTQVGSASTWVSAVTDGLATFATTSTGQLLGAGSNTYGNLGLGTIAFATSFVQVGAAPGWSVVDTYQYYDANGGTYRGHACAIRSGELYCWGMGSYGMLGTGNTNDQSTPTLVPGASDWTQVTTGGLHSCALASTGKLYCWGRNASGQLGDASNIDRSSPVQESTGASNWTWVGAGHQHTCALNSLKQSFCWGENGSYQLGDGSASPVNTPKQVGTASNWDQLTVGADHACGVNSADELWCWGRGSAGELGDGSGSNRSTPTQVTLPGTSWSWVSAGFGLASFAVDGIDGFLYRTGRWGAPAAGEFASDSSLNRLVLFDNARTWSTLSDVLRSSIGVTTGNQLFVWGFNEAGQLGDGTGFYVVPQAVTVP